MKPTTHKNPNSGAKDNKKMTKQQLTKQKVRNTLNKSNKKIVKWVSQLPAKTYTDVHGGRH